MQIGILGMDVQKISQGCKYCYVYRQDEMYGSITDSSLCHKNASFDLPLKKKKE